MALVSISRGCIIGKPKGVLQIDALWHVSSLDWACSSVGRTLAASSSIMIHHFAAYVKKDDMVE